MCVSFVVGEGKDLYIEKCKDQILFRWEGKIWGGIKEINVGIFVKLEKIEMACHVAKKRNVVSIWHLRYVTYVNYGD